jgi:hypothetical protein
VPGDDGSYLILGGPLASADAGTALCGQLQARDGSVECQVVTN